MTLVLQRPTSFKVEIASDLWILKHNLNRTVGVDVFIHTDAGTLEKVIPSEIIKIDDNTVHVTWPWPMVGEATVA